MYLKGGYHSVSTIVESAATKNGTVLKSNAREKKYCLCVKNGEIQSWFDSNHLNLKKTILPDSNEYSGAIPVDTSLFLTAEKITSSGTRGHGVQLMDFGIGFLSPPFFEKRGYGDISRGQNQAGTGIPVPAAGWAGTLPWIPVPAAKIWWIP